MRDWDMTRKRDQAYARVSELRQRMRRWEEEIKREGEGRKFGLLPGRCQKCGRTGYMFTGYDPLWKITCKCGRGDTVGAVVENARVYSRKYREWWDGHERDRKDELWEEVTMPVPEEKPAPVPSDTHDPGQCPHCGKRCEVLKAFGAGDRFACTCGEVSTAAQLRESGRDQWGG